jgi:hypothetical protein
MAFWLITANYEVLRKLGFSEEKVSFILTVEE